MTMLGSDPADDADDPGSLQSLLSGPSYALIVGIDSYGNGINPLTGAAADATAVAAVLGDSHRKDRYDPVQLLLNEEATRKGILRAFFELRRRIAKNPHARVVLYFAGHGIATIAPDDSGTTPGYFLPQDAKRGNVKTFLSMTDVRKAIDGLHCHHLLLVLDCCFAGAFRWGNTRAAPPADRLLTEERLRRYLRDPAWHVITSASADETALDTVPGKVMITGTRAELAASKDNPDGPRSPFARALVTALAGEADTNPDGVITGSEIYSHVQMQFDNWAKDTKQTFQIPSFFHWPKRESNKGEFVFLNPLTQVTLGKAVTLGPENNPYRGFASYPYTPRNSTVPAPPSLFFGRAKLTEKLVAMIEAQPIVVVLGASGTGKSSLVCAGALPALEKTGWQPLPVVRPVAEPMKALDALARSLDEEAGDGALTKTVAGFFVKNPDAYSGATRPPVPTVPGH